MDFFYDYELMQPVKLSVNLKLIIVSTHDISVLSIILFTDEKKGKTIAFGSSRRDKPDIIVS